MTPSGFPSTPTIGQVKRLRVTNPLRRSISGLNRGSEYGSLTSTSELVQNACPTMPADCGTRISAELTATFVQSCCASASCRKMLAARSPACRCRFRPRAATAGPTPSALPADARPPAPCASARRPAERQMPAPGWSRNVCQSGIFNSHDCPIVREALVQPLFRWNCQQMNAACKQSAVARDSRTGDSRR